MSLAAKSRGASKRLLVAALGSMALALALAALGAAQARAEATLLPASQDFGSLPLGATSAPKTYTLTVVCTPGPMGCQMDPFNVSVAIENPTAFPDFSQTNNCPMFFPGFNSTATGADKCTIMVTFTPIAPGPRGAVVDTGSHVLGNPPFPPAPGPTGQALGTGLFMSSSPGGSGAAGGFVSAGVPGRKKCHKKKSRKASAAKKRRCKKHRK